MWEPNNHCRNFDVGRSHAQMIKLLNETLASNDTNRGHQHNAHKYTSRF